MARFFITRFCACCDVLLDFIGTLLIPCVLKKICLFLRQRIFTCLLEWDGKEDSLKFFQIFDQRMYKPILSKILKL